MTEKSKKISITFDKDNRDRRKTAYDVLQKRIDDLLNAKNTDIDKLTLKDLVERYRKYQQKTVKPSTYRRNYHATTTLMNILGEDTPNREVFIQPELESLIIEINIYNATRKLQYGYQNPNQIFMPSKVCSVKKLLFSQDVDFETLARRLGNKNSRITKEIYTHVTKRLKEKDNTQIRNTKII